MKRVLVVSIACPPKNDPECLQVAKYLKYLRQAGLVLDLLTSSVPTLFMPYDEGLERYNLAGGDKVEIRIWESKVTNFFLRKLVPGGINYPDSKFTFHLQSKKAIKRITHRPDVIYSRSNPLSSALMAFKMKEHFQVPWVMHLSDPWIGSPTARYSKSEHRFNEKWERRCFQVADRISFTTQKTLEFYRSRYPAVAEKFFISPNVYDADDVMAVPPDFTGRLRVIYTGGLAGDRSAAFFLQACAEIWNTYPEFGNIEIIFAGAIDSKNREVIQRCNLPFVKHLGEIPYLDALRLQQTAHILLTIDQPLEGPEKAMFIPSKILDYFVAKRRILAITNRQSSTAAILSFSRSSVVYYDQIDLLKDFLLRAFAAFGEKNSSFFTTEEIPLHFSAEENSLKLATILNSL